MAKTTKLVKQNDGIFHVEIPEEFLSKLEWEAGHILKIDTEDNKLVIEKLNGFMGK